MLPGLGAQFTRRPVNDGEGRALKRWGDPSPKSVRRSSMSRKLALALFGAITLVALPLCYAQGGDAAKDRRDIRKDRQDIRQDKRERREDRRELRQDVKKGDTQGAREERREIRKDTRDIRKDKRDLREDRKDRREDRREERGGK